MFSRKILSSILCLCLLTGLLPVPCLASEPSSENTVEASDSSNSLGEIGGYLSSNALTTLKLFQDRNFSAPGGMGFAAENANNLIDRFHGLNATVVGGNNAKNGADRMIINRSGSVTWIQDKYYNTAAKSVNAAFDKDTGLYRYLDGSGKPMQLEVPSDQYTEAVDKMREKIKAGLVPGVTDPDEASNLIRKGRITLKQAENIAKAGTVDSLKYDAANGAVIAVSSAGISFVLDYTCCRLNGISPKAALKDAGLNGLKSGCVIFATHVISSQLAKAGASGAFIPVADAIANSLGKEVCEAIVQQVGLKSVGAEAVKQVGKIIANQLVADGVLVIVLTAADVASLFRGRISKEELLKNLSVTVVTLGAGAAGGYGGAALGSLIAPGAGTAIGGILGSVAAGTLSAWAAESLIAPYYESDAEEMFQIISTEFTVLCSDYLISEEEGTHITEKLRSELIGDTLKDMYASENRQQFAQDLLMPLFTEEIQKREQIVLPDEDELRHEMKSALDGVVFIH